MAASNPPSDSPQPTATSTTVNDTSTDNNMAAVMAATTLSTPLPRLTTENLQRLTTASPPHSNPSSPGGLSQRRSKSPNLSLDLSNLPSLSTPAPPSNTLLITKLTDAKIFHPASLATIRQHISSIAPLNSFSPLKSMSRIIVSFYDDASAIKVRQAIDGTAFAPTSIAKCYFGEPTPIGDEKKYLERPDAGKLFFISPPPSPPVGWEMRTEDPPNQQTHAEDLLAKLEKLTARMESADSAPSPVDDYKQYTAEEMAKIKSPSPVNPHKRQSSFMSEDAAGTPPKMRSRSSTLIYDPKAHGDSPALPAVMLETEDESDVELDADPRRSPMAHTARPPVELMQE